jgi:hypothetical protein
MHLLLIPSEKNINNYKPENCSDSNNKSAFISISVTLAMAFFSQD